MEPSITLDEAKVIAASKDGPKVTEERIKAKIADVTYIRPYANDFTPGSLTICIITMKNNFKFIGKSAPVSPDNFSDVVGKRYAYEDAFKQIWSHEGYLLRTSLSIPE